MVKPILVIQIFVVVVDHHFYRLVPNVVIRIRLNHCSVENVDRSCVARCVDSYLVKVLSLLLQLRYSICWVDMIIKNIHESADDSKIINGVRELNPQ